MRLLTKDSKMGLAPLFVRRKQRIAVLIIEDNEFYNALIKRVLDDYKKTLPASSGIELTVDSYTDADEIAHDILKGKYNGITVFAFIDYYLGYGAKGTTLANLLTQLSPNNKSIVLTQSNDEGLISQLNNDVSVSECLQKSQNTPYDCRAKLKNFLVR